ncbi:MAG: TIGR03619 family F420-dependent LLM class oxidoreductase [Gammaproteobacteria bacterium]|jgi:probable F420-dependent oxidoreductase|nr:TIGR03619 family F420-dependent LLM class oxidoreductase [Gammaproteobacteria bacterium]MBK6585242.1 TIGR03619 family F420-dependent LLM class oxidoreductase [Gammaproteobacteria bacterium]MBK7730703.1 TIGR03619 family F420-dependent LLM class oxidoreductase [Gammaproteobacteria bacterium]MBK9666910.1 TIGR03619 family F420-dependent LLM class oxidoreductase [Gammaproteobacteria bacterium]MBP6229227.1 TIGR03619 family F420-dependent LLM class oxidoreductase [Pseudomonadales bacterium]
MKFWQAVTWMEPEQLVGVARFAEELGFEGIFNGDHGVYPQRVRAPYPYSADGKPPMTPDSDYPDCWVSIAFMAAATTRLRFTTSVYVLPLRNPFEVARATGTLSLLSNERFVLGIGAGWMKDEFDIYGVDFHTRGKRLDEMVVVLRKLWTGGMVEHHGRFFDFEPLQIAPAPRCPVPIYTGGGSAIALRRAAYTADGWIGAGNTAEEVPGILAELGRLRTEAGRSDLPFETIIGLKTPLDRDTLQSLGEQGMSACVNYPFQFSLGRRSTLEQKKRVMEDFAEKMIRARG